MKSKKSKAGKGKLRKAKPIRKIQTLRASSSLHK